MSGVPTEDRTPSFCQPCFDTPNLDSPHLSTATSSRQLRQHWLECGLMGLLSAPATFSWVAVERRVGLLHLDWRVWLPCLKPQWNTQMDSMVTLGRGKAGSSCPCSHTHSWEHLRSSWGTVSQRSPPGPKHQVGQIPTPASQDGCPCGLR